MTVWRLVSKQNSLTTR